MFFIVAVLLLGVICAFTFVAGRRMEKAEDVPATDRYSSGVNRRSERVAGKAMWISALAVFFGTVVLWTPFAITAQVPAGYQGLVYQFGDIVDQKDPGVVFVWPWQKVVNANTQVQRHSFDQLDSFSSETQNVFIKATINYEVEPEDIQNLYRNVGPNYFDKLVPTRVNQIFKDETVKYRAVEIAPNREEIRATVLARIKAELQPFSIKLNDLLIDNISFSPEFTHAIEEKQIATQNAQTAQNRVKQAQFEADQLIEKAQGEAAAYRLRQKNLTPLLVQQNAIDKLNDNVQIMIVPSNNNLFLNPQGLLGKGK